MLISFNFNENLLYLFFFMIVKIIQSYIDEDFNLKNEFFSFVYYFSQGLLIIFYCIEKYLPNKDNNTLNKIF